MFNIEYFIPNWILDNWNDFYKWEIILSDFLIFTSCFLTLILLLNIYFNKQSLKNYVIFSSLFIILCYLINLLETIIFWHLANKFQLHLKFATSILSIITCIWIITLRPIKLIEDYFKTKKMINLFEKSFHSSPIGKVIVDLKGNAIICNNSFKKILDINKNNIKENIFELLQINIKDITNNNFIDYSTKVMFIKESKEKLWLNVCIIPNIGTAGNVEEYIVQIQKITDSYYYFMFLDRIINCNKDFYIAAFDESLNYIFGNEKLNNEYDSIFNKKPIIGDNYNILIDEIKNFLKQSQLNNEIIFKQIKVNNTHYELMIYPVYNETILIGYALMIFDITQKMEDLKKINNYNKSLQQFVYICSHDLQEPIKRIFGFLDLITKNSIEKFTEKELEWFNCAVLSAKRMSSLIDGLLKYSKLNNAIKFEKININIIIKEFIEEHSNIIKESDAIIDIQEYMPIITGIEHQIYLLFKNLILNSIKFRKKNVQSYIKIYCEEYKNYYKIIIEDNGIGIEKENYQKIFDVFKKLDKNSDGIGMGLAICKKIIENHYGEIGLESVLGEGSKFWFHIPK